MMTQEQLSDVRQRLLEQQARQNQLLFAFYHLFKDTGTLRWRRQMVFDRTTLTESEFYEAHKALTEEKLVDYTTQGGMSGVSTLTDKGINQAEEGLAADQGKVRIAITPQARDALREFLMSDQMMGSGEGYSEFILKAVKHRQDNPTPHEQLRGQNGL